MMKMKYFLLVRMSIFYWTFSLHYEKLKYGMMVDGGTPALQREQQAFDELQLQQYLRVVQ